MADVAAEFGKLRVDQPTDYAGKVEGLSTIFPLEIKKGSVAYRYNVEIVKNPDNKQKAKELTKQNDPGMRSAQRTCCYEILEALFTKTEGFGTGAKYVYDGKRVLYTNKEIKLKQTTRLTAGELPQRAAIFVRREDVNIRIMANEAAPKLDYSNLNTALVADVTVQADRSVRTFLEILTSQYLINTDSYQYISAGCLFSNDTYDLVEGMQSRMGFKKGVRISGKGDNAKALLVMDMKRTAFFANRTAIEIYNQFVSGPNDRRGQRQFETLMRGVRFVVTYDTSRTILFGKLTRNPVNSREYNIDQQSIPEFILSRKKITLNFPNALGVHPDQPGGHKIVYPLEVLRVLQGQLVPTEKLTGRASQRLLTENSISASDRYRYVVQQTRAVATGDAANFLNQWGVRILMDNKVDINIRQLPNIQYGNNQIVQPKNGSWFDGNKNAKFVLPSSKLKNWVVAYDAGIQANVVKTYISKMLSAARASGMDNLPDPKGYYQVPLAELDSFFKEYHQKVQFIFYVDEDRVKSHGMLKLLEAYYKVLTQHIVAKNLNCGPQTLKNVVMKLNTKTFGLCFVPTIAPSIRDWSADKEDLLIIGLDISHPQKLNAKDRFMLKKKHPELENKHPSVVGIAANKMAARFGFAGDFFYQETNRESINPDLLRTAVKQLVEVAAKNNKKVPARVIVIRDGISEGEQQNAALNEVPAIRAGIKDVHISLDPKITFIVGTKDHNKRVYRAVGKEASNTEPGDIVSSKIVREDVPEFFIQSHKPLKGVPKMLQTAFVRNDLGLTMGQVQEIIFNLASMHQVAATSTSKPLPTYLAHETSKRGMEIYNELYKIRFGSYGPPSQFAQELVASADGLFNFEELTEKLGYATSKLVGTRFNA